MKKPENASICVVEGSVCAVEGSVCAVEGSVCVVEGSVCAVEGSVCVVEGSVCVVEVVHFHKPGVIFDEKFMFLTYINVLIYMFLLFNKFFY